jgi:hypothetical protein
MNVSKGHRYLILFCKLTLASDTIKFVRTFPKVEAEVLKDTFMNISKTSLDTFGHRPTFVFIARQYDGIIRKGFHHQLYFQSVKDPKVGLFETLNGINDSIDFSTGLFFKEGEKYTVKILYSDGRQVDTINLKTTITVGSKSSLTYVYEVRTGIREYRVSCEIYNQKKISKEQKEIMLAFLQAQPRYYFGSERANSNLRSTTIKLLELTDKQAKRIHCNCRTSW